VTGVKALAPGGGSVVARREAAGGGWESFELPLPAVVTVKEGINLPRYPSVPGRLRARKKEIERSTPEWRAGGLEKIVLRLPKEERTAAQVIGQGPDAAPAVVDLLAKIGVVDG
jgi:electron transfer flavoprotein beta subunit